MDTVPAPSRASFAGAIVVPTYNNAGTLIEVLEALLSHGLPIVVVNDGSTDDTGPLLDVWCRHLDDALVERHETNLGKGRALRTGFDAARRLGATHALTIDSDGQHDPSDVPALLDLAAARADAIVVGVRPAHVPGYPRRCRLGRRVANTLVWIQTLLRLEDTQCGLRVYPLDLARSLDCRAERFGYETEVIVRAAWAGCEIIESPVSCRYELPGGRVSHWRPVVDTLRDARLHARLFARSLVPVPHARWRQDEERRRLPRSLRRFVAWVSPVALWREMRQASHDGRHVAMSTAVGAFIGCSPFYGLHTWLSLYGAWRLRLHPLPAVLGSLVSTPPLGILIVAASVQVGHLLRTGAWLAPSALENQAAWWTLPLWSLVDWLLGSVVVGLLVALGVFVAMRCVAQVVSRRQGPPAPADRRAERAEGLAGASRSG